MVDALLLAARLLLAGIFGLAGVAKLRDLDGARRTLKDFGVPSALATPLGLALPVAELMVASALIPLRSARYGSIGALVLLLMFIAAISISLVRGRRPDCHCFGQIHSAPIGGRVLVRNAVLALVAAFLATVGWANSGSSAGAWLIPLSAAERVGALAGVLGLALLVWQSVLLRTLIAQNRRLLHLIATSPTAAASGVMTDTPAPSAPIVTLPREAGHPAGTPAPALELTNLFSGVVTLDGLRAAGRPVVLIFSDPDCGPCTALLPDIGRWQREHAAALTVAVLSRGTVEANLAMSSDLDPARVLLQRDREAMTAFGVIGTPSAVIVRPDGTIGGLLAQAEAEIRQLIARWTPQPDSNRLQPLAPAPGFTLANLDGEQVTLAQFKGKPTLILFWNPFCIHCSRMLGDLRAWESRPLADRAQLLVVATGSAEDNRSQGLRSTMVLDPQFTVGPLYGVEGTPSAVLVDADGRLAGPLVVGSSAVLALAGQQETPHEEATVAVERTLGGIRPVPLTTLPPDAKPIRQECVQDELLSDGSLVLYNGCQQQVLTLNATAALVWEYCDGDHGVEAIVAEVRDVFPTAADAEHDVRELLDTLLRGQMIAPAQMTPAAAVS